MVFVVVLLKLKPALIGCTMDRNSSLMRLQCLWCWLETQAYYWTCASLSLSLSLLLLEKQCLSQTGCSQKIDYQNASADHWTILGRVMKHLTPSLIPLINLDNFRDCDPPPSIWYNLQSSTRLQTPWNLALAHLHPRCSTSEPEKAEAPWSEWCSEKHMSYDDSEIMSHFQQQLQQS